MRELYSTAYNSERFTDENVLYKNDLIDSPTLSRGLTYLYGKDSNMFPLLSLTEGQNGLLSMKPKELNDTQYTWNVMGRMKHTSRVVGLANPNNAKPGLGFTPFDVYFEDDWFLKFYGATTPDKQHNVRIQGSPTKIGEKKFKVTFALNTSNPEEYVSLDNFIGNVAWVMTAPSVGASHSDGTSSNSMAPGKWSNQFGFLRFSKQIAGNIANKVTNIEFDLEGGGTTNMWMPWEMRQFEIDRRLMLEEELWNGKYNRDKYGQIHLKDSESGEVIPKGAGVKEILKTTGQYDTYGTLTLKKIDSIITNLFSNRVDNTPMELVFYTGTGGMRAFNEAIKVDARTNQYYYKLSEAEIMSGKDGYLSYGKYFMQYKTIDGYIITMKHANIFDKGLYAELDRANGNMYNGLPAESYNMVLLDMSTNDDGERNVQLVGEKGREVVTGIYKGMSPLPGAWGAIDNGKLLSTKKDEASYEVFVSQGITLKNYTTSYFLEFVK